MTYSKSSDYYEEPEVYEDSYEDFKNEVEWMKRTAPPLPADCINALPMPDKHQEIPHQSKIRKNDDDELQKLATALLDETDKRFEEIASQLKLEDVIADSRKAYSEIPMYDFGLGEKSNCQAVMDFYGYDLYNRIYMEIHESYECPSDHRERGQITKELWQTLRDIRAGRIAHPNSNRKKEIPQPRPTEQRETSNTGRPVSSNLKNAKTIQVEKRKRQPGDDYSLLTERGLIRNESYRELFKGPGMIYELIWSNLVRKGWRDTEQYPIRKKFHDERKLLVYCTSYRYLADQCGMSHNTVRKIIERFKEAGIVKVELFTPKRQKQQQVVLILGYWTGNDKHYKEHLYRNEMFLSPKPVKN
jgi:hypothetical protein